jgi:hypothetical protein
MARIKRPAGPNATPTYDAPKVRQPSRRTHGTAKDHMAAKQRAQQKAAGATVDSGGGALDDTQLNLIAANHQDYYDTLLSPFYGGGGMPSGMGSNPYWNDYTDRAFRSAETGYTSALQANPNLHYASYMQSLGAGGGGGQMAPIDTGNPFTSSSGTGAAPAASPYATLMQNLGKKPDKQQQPNQFARWKKKKKGQVGAAEAPDPADLGEIGVDPATSGVNYADALRRGFLALSPMERGDVALGKVATPARWSPWG